MEINMPKHNTPKHRILRVKHRCQVCGFSYDERIDEEGEEGKKFFFTPRERMCAKCLIALEIRYHPMET